MISEQEMFIRTAACMILQGILSKGDKEINAVERSIDYAFELDELISNRFKSKNVNASFKHEGLSRIKVS